MNHGELSCKDNLVTNMKKACETLKKDVLAYLPMTFIVNFNGKAKDNQMDEFIQVFSTVERLK
jgi:hypothetical protein